MSVIRYIGPSLYNLTKIIRIEKGITMILRRPYIQITTNITNNFEKNMFFGCDEHNRIYFESIDMCQQEFNEIKNTLEEYYKK
jgi:hypothetical protein